GAWISAHPNKTESARDRRSQAHAHLPTPEKTSAETDIRAWSLDAHPPPNYSPELVPLDSFGHSGAHFGSYTLSAKTLTVSSGEFPAQNQPRFGAGANGGWLTSAE